MVEMPQDVHDIVPDGDVVLVVSGMTTAPDAKIGLRVSRAALIMASPVFRTRVAAAASGVSIDEGHDCILLEIPAHDSGDAMFILCNILHLRNDKLAPRIPPDLLCKVAMLARKYECVVAVGRATLSWFDRLYTSKDPGDLWKIIEAAYLLDEAVYFARFTSRWILQAPMQGPGLRISDHPETSQLSIVLNAHHTQNTILLRTDLDRLASESCIFSFSAEYKHYIDWAPGISPDPGETTTDQPPVECRVDADGAMMYLGALRDADIWPPTAWKVAGIAGAKGDTIRSVVERVAAFRAPEYDDADKCEFCDDAKGNLTTQLGKLREVHRERLWGLCLDCYKAGGVYTGECRFEHQKVR